jgi:uncharacterized protein YkwD
MKYKKEYLILFCLILFSLIGGKELFASTKYIIKSGDTMWRVAFKHNLDLETILRENPHIKNPRLIYPGDIIFLPESGGMSQVHPDNLYLLSLINKEREKAYLKPVQLDENLMKAAAKKSKDMMLHEYVAHKSPTYGNPNDMLKALHIPFRSVHENVGAGPKRPEEIFRTWVNSPVNYRNLTDKHITHVGIGYAKGGLHGSYWTIILIE